MILVHDQFLLSYAGFSEYVYHFGRSLSTTINFFPHSHLMSLCLGNTTGDGFATKVASNSLYIVDVRRLGLAVVAAVWSCDGAKSPAPDGFSLEIFKSC